MMKSLKQARRVFAEDARPLRVETITAPKRSVRALLAQARALLKRNHRAKSLRRSAQVLKSLLKAMAMPKLVSPKAARGLSLLPDEVAGDGAGRAKVSQQ